MDEGPESPSPNCKVEIKLLRWANRDVSYSIPVPVTFYGSHKTPPRLLVQTLQFPGLLHCSQTSLLKLNPKCLSLNLINRLRSYIRSNVKL